MKFSLRSARKTGAPEMGPRRHRLQPQPTPPRTGPGGQAALRPALLALLVAVLLWLPAWPAAAAGSGPSRAALVVRFSDGRVETRCVAFEEAAISGAELLERAGLGPIFDHGSGLGGAVCSIAGEGCAFPREECFCRCQGATCEYWAYYHGHDGRWLYSEIGASSYEVTDGAVEGWSWGQGSFSAGTEPPFFSFDAVCAPQTAAAAPSGSLLAPWPTLRSCKVRSRPRRRPSRR